MATIGHLLKLLCVVHLVAPRNGGCVLLPRGVLPLLGAVMFCGGVLPRRYAAVICGRVFPRCFAGMSRGTIAAQNQAAAFCQCYLAYKPLVAAPVRCGADGQ